MKKYEISFRKIKNNCVHYDHDNTCCMHTKNTNDCKDDNCPITKKLDKIICD